MSRCIVVSLVVFFVSCKPEPSSQPTKEPINSAWAGAESLSLGKAELCQASAFAADPFSNGWFFTHKENVCSLGLISLKNPSAKTSFSLEATQDCATVSRIGDLTTSLSEQNTPPEALYLIGDLSVKRMIDESGGISFEGKNNNKLLHIELERLRQGSVVVKQVDTKETMRSALLEELQKWSSSLEEDNKFEIERDKRAIVLGGLAAAPGNKFLVGLTSPRMCQIDSKESCRAILFLLDDISTMFDEKPKSPRVLMHAPLVLDGSGITSLEYESRSESFLLTTVSGNAFLLRFRGELEEISLVPLSFPTAGTASLRSMVPAPGGAAAFFVQTTPDCSLQWFPMTLDTLTRVP